MILFIVAFVVIMVAITLMAIGVILSSKPIKGSCGGLGSLGLKESCPICGDEKEITDSVSEKLTELAYIPKS